jgi:hypothetical protein
MKRALVAAAVVGALGASAGAGCLQVLGDPYTLGSGGGGAGTTTSMTSSSGATTTTASSSGTTTTTASSSGMTSSSGTTTTTASSSGTGGAGGVIVLEDGLLGPDAIAVDTEYVYFTTNNPPSGPSTAGFVSKDGMQHGTPVTGVLGAPAIASPGSGAYAATWAGTSQGTLYTFSGGTAATVVGTVMDTTLGVAVWGATVYFTTTGSKAWMIPPGGMPVVLSSAAGIASGPIVADSTGVYWPTTTDHMVSAGLTGGNPTQLCTVAASVNAVTTDSSFVYWTDQSGGVYRVSKNSDAGTPETLNGGNGTPAYGIAVDNAGDVYFAQGSQVLRIVFPFGAPPTVLAGGLSHPRGVALDGTFVYVAEQGTPSTSDGSILKITP